MPPKNNYAEIIKEYHNHKERDFDPETGVIYAPGNKEFIKNKQLEEGEQRSRELGDGEIIKQQVMDAVSKINSIRLRPGAENDSRQTELLEKKKKQAKKMIYQTLTGISEYMTSLSKFDSIIIDKEKYDQNIYLKMREEADKYRQIKHNALINNLKTAIRFISFNFRDENDLNEGLFEKWREKEENIEKTILDIQRIKFPANIICPDAVDLNDRKKIMDWALQLRDSISSLKKELL